MPTSWVYQLRKEDLIRELEERGWKNMEIVGKFYRKWNIHFDGTGDPVEFIEKIEELIDTTGADKFKLLLIIPRILQGKVLQWYRNYRSEWKTWENFIADFKFFYFPQNYENRLLEKIIFISY
ncbi:hypothetical protein ACJJTC_017979 [Scirpophaga incertulas]